MRLFWKGLLFLSSVQCAYYLDKSIPDHRCKSDEPTTCISIRVGYGEHKYFGSGERGLTFSLSAQGRLSQSVSLGANQISPVISTSIKIQPKTDVPDGKKVFHFYCPGLVNNQNDDSTAPFYMTNIGDTQIISPDFVPLTSHIKPPHDFVYTQKFNFGGPNESQQVIATSNCSFGLTEAIVQEDLLRTAKTKSLIISSQDDLNIQTELHQQTVNDDSNDATAEDTLLDATDQAPTDSSDDDTNQSTSDQGTSAHDGTSSGTEPSESDEGTPESSSGKSAVSDNQIELPEQIELRDTTIGKLFDGSNSPFKITVYCYIDGSEIEELRLIYDDVQLTSPPTIVSTPASSTASVSSSQAVDVETGSGDSAIAGDDLDDKNTPPKNTSQTETPKPAINETEDKGVGINATAPSFDQCISECLSVENGGASGNGTDSSSNDNFNGVKLLIACFLVFNTL